MKTQDKDYQSKSITFNFISKELEEEFSVVFFNEEEVVLKDL